MNEHRCKEASRLSGDRYSPKLCSRGGDTDCCRSAAGVTQNAAVVNKGNCGASADKGGLCRLPQADKAPLCPHKAPVPIFLLGAEHMWTTCVKRMWPSHALAFAPSTDADMRQECRRLTPNCRCKVPQTAAAEYLPLSGCRRLPLIDADCRCKELYFVSPMLTELATRTYSNWQYRRRGSKTFGFGMFSKNSQYLNGFCTDSHET
ncbi:hypothetical protein DFH09DRAFT_1069366 [Mycena vulgaris]|nr:hypothetical protein DFH09DRAFT_1069366 [Mycena vulgaris]